MLHRHSFHLAMVFIAMLVLPPATRNASGADAERGVALYKSSCVNCHSESVHGRTKREATDFNDVRRWVNRWNENLRLRWGDEEIDDVSVYLNNTYYRFACPPQVCKVVSLSSAPALEGVFALAPSSHGSPLPSTPANGPRP